MKIIIIIGIIFLCIEHLRITIGGVISLKKLGLGVKVASIAEIIITTFTLILLIVSYFK